jgi:DNA topoisomerase III
VLFDAPIETKIPSESKSIEKNLTNEARGADMLMIWTDCDREGEHIGSEIAGVCRRAKRNIIVKRARFSAIIAQCVLTPIFYHHHKMNRYASRQIHHAAQHPVELDRAQADAVEARILLDLRIGAAFTRMQTLTLQGRFAQLNEKRDPVSYGMSDISATCRQTIHSTLQHPGPCQFPTLGFVVSRYTQVKAFVPEKFWYIFLSLSRPPSSSSAPEETQFNWRRGHLFDFDVAVAIYQHVLSDSDARVVKVVQKPTKKW